LRLFHDIEVSKEEFRIGVIDFLRQLIEIQLRDVKEPAIRQSRTHLRHRHPSRAIIALTWLFIALMALSSLPARALAVESHRFNFEQDITPLLSRFGCNAAGCHGKAEGQNGFKLSVFGYDPRADYDALVKEARGRRVSPALPDRSLMLLKASGGIPHGGGVRFSPGSPEYQTIRDWISAGMPFGSPDDPVVDHITVAPSQGVMKLESTQQLRVTAVYTDGHAVDVTRLAQFQTNNEALAKVDEHGLVAIAEVPGQAAIMARFMGQMAVFRAWIPRPQKIDKYPELPEYNFVDKLVDAQLKKLNIIPSGLADDSEFVRRVYLDVIGTLPTADETRRFLADRRPDRRARLVDELLGRPEYADYWSMKWADLLRVDRATLGYRDAFNYYMWIHDSLAANKPVDRMTRELLTVDGPESEGGEAAFYKAIARRGDVAATVSQVFLGVRIACAECHHHPFDQWATTDYYGMAAFFQNVNFKKVADTEELTADGAAQAQNPRTKKIIFAHPLTLAAPQTVATGDQRHVLADWLTSPTNPWFARNMANRMAAHFLGRGLIEPVDDVRSTNPPSNPQLLDALAIQLVDSKFDMKKLIRVIAASRVYQSSSKPNETNELDEQNYSRALFKRMPAEVLLDAVCQTTGVPEKFPGVAAGSRAIQLWDSDVHHYFLRLFGRPVRKTSCECERNVDASVAQVLHLMNSPQIQAKLSHESGRVANLVRTISDDGMLVDELYLTFLSRPPTQDERKYAIEYIERQASQRQHGVEDLAWSLMNTLEFVFNH
jgi:hypothetical protein